MQSKKIAEWFLRHEADTSDQATVTNMKLQKLVYLAESCYGALYGAPLLDEPVQAWDHGPAVKPLYGAYKCNQNRPIPAPAAAPALPEAVTEVLETVWDTFGSLAPAQLRKMTHDLGPYEDHYRPGVMNIVLPPAEIHEAWAEFLDEGLARTRQPDSPAMATLWRLQHAGGGVAEDEAVDVEQLMSDFHAFAAAG